MQLYRSKNPLAMYLATIRYDLTVYLSDGSLPLLGSRKNLIHMQVPFHNVGGKSLKNKLKGLFCQAIIVNSNFTKGIIDQEYGVDSLILYPPVELIGKGDTKENVILSVGRFEPSLNAKKQDVLIEAFRILHQANPDWRLVLAGASASDSWVSHLQRLAGDLPVELATNISHDNLRALYGRASVYWHAAGYGVDATKNPELTEHFGISTVEAISAGCVPFVVGKGGQKEIVTNDALYWNTPQELAAKTSNWIKSREATPALPADYSYQSFASKLQAIISRI
jgi:glycosyltransferase involved in cell wall biosynthesis